MKFQLIKVLHHNRAMYDPAYFKKGHRVFIVEKLFEDDGTFIEKRVTEIEKPTIKFFVTKEEYMDLHKRPEKIISREHVEEVEAPYSQIDLIAAKLTDQMDFYERTKGSGAKRARKKIHLHRALHGSDASLDDHYIDRYFLLRGDDLDQFNPPLKKAYGDIEVDIIDYDEFPDEHLAPCPIWILGHFVNSEKTLYQFACRNNSRENPLIKEFENNLTYNQAAITAYTNLGLIKKIYEKDGKYKDLSYNSSPEELFEIMGINPDGSINENNELSKRLRNRKTVIKFYDTELETILAYLHHKNEICKPDTYAFWNGRFDILTIINRLKRNKYDPAKAFSSSSFNGWHYENYYEDLKNIDADEKADVFSAANETIYYDQMLVYAQLRKGKKLESTALDFILEKELSENKLSISSIKTILYDDYFRAVLYHAHDIVPMSTLEDVVGDIDQSYMLMGITRTNPNKVMKKTIALRNLAYHFYRNKGYMLSNNHNRLNDMIETEKFDGAYVLDPMLLDNVGYDFGDGNRSNRVFDDVVDFDATSLYPSIGIAGNMDTQSLIGRLYDEMGDPLEELFCQKIISNEYLDIGSYNFNLPTLNEWCELLDDFNQTECQ